uniref:Uncharacterized protein n=1 Tax=Heterorhabditis bacteriophora TaxID=37862 RepID=A0A1I7XSQ4_HETBA
MVYSLDDGSSQGKRRRSGTESGVLHKKLRKEENVAQNTMMEKGKRKRIRKRTKGLRKKIKDEIERALRTCPSPLAHLFTTVDENGTPQAVFREVVRSVHLDESKVNMSNSESLSFGIYIFLTMLTKVRRINLIRLTRRRRRSFNENLALIRLRRTKRILLRREIVLQKKRDKAKDKPENGIRITVHCLYVVL